MIKKLIISAVVLTVLIAGKEANAAGPGAFARSLGSAPAVHLYLAESFAAPAVISIAHDSGFADATPGAMDAYFDLFAGALSLEQGACGRI